MTPALTRQCGAHNQQSIDYTYTHQDATKDEHVQEIGSLAMIMILLQHSTVPVGKDKVEEEVKTE